MSEWGGGKWCAALLQAHVLKAACTALKPEVSAGLELCKELTKGTCAPGTAGDKMCGSALYADINRSVCKEADNEAGFTCAAISYTFVLCGGRGSVMSCARLG